MSIRFALPIAAAAAALLLPGGAQAMTVAVEDGVLHITAERGELNSVNIEAAANKRVRLAQDARTEVGAGCNRVEADVYCNAESAILVDLRDGNDELYMRPGLPAPLRYVGGTGRDLVRWTHVDGIAVAADNDGQADDGPLGLDDIEADVEVVQGSFANDVIGSGSRGASLDGTEGDDIVRGGSGPDRITAGYLATDGTEAGHLFSQGVDTVSCGGGQDFVLHDLGDSIAGDCEAFGRPSLDPGFRGFSFGGSPGDDFMGAPSGWSPAQMYSGSGDDVVQGPDDGSNRAELGAGNDRFRGGGANIVRAHSGNDYVDVRNRNTGDRVDCGGGRDRVIADRGDRIARNCERVTRRSIAR